MYVNCVLAYYTGQVELAWTRRFRFVSGEILK